jgi:hypothetical protein
MLAKLLQGVVDSDGNLTVRLTALRHAWRADKLQCTPLARRMRRAGLGRVRLIDPHFTSGESRLTGLAGFRLSRHSGTPRGELTGNDSWQSPSNRQILPESHRPPGYKTPVQLVHMDMRENR